MIIDVNVPQLSESVAEATLVAWHKKVGEAVSRDENLIDIETDKVSVGSTVTLRDRKVGDVRIYTLVGSAEADPTKAKLSNESPVGQAILGKRVGDVVTVNIPIGALDLEILAIGKM